VQITYLNSVDDILQKKMKIFLKPIDKK